jgi:hypothetical protein
MKLKEPPGTCCTGDDGEPRDDHDHSHALRLDGNASRIHFVGAVRVGSLRVAWSHRGCNLYWVGRKQDLDDALPQLQVLINACRGLQALAAGGTARRVYAPVRRTRYIDRNRSLYYLCTLISGGYRCTPNAAGGGTVLEWHDRDTRTASGPFSEPEVTEYMRCRRLLPPGTP